MKQESVNKTLGLNQTATTGSADPYRFVRRPFVIVSRMEFDTWEKPMPHCHARFLSAKLPNVNTKRSSWAIQPGFQTTSGDSFAASVKGYLGHHWENSKFEKGLGAQNRKKTGKPTELAPSPACHACHVHMDAWGIGSNSPDISWMLL